MENSPFTNSHLMTSSQGKNEAHKLKGYCNLSGFSGDVWVANVDVCEIQHTFGVGIVCCYNKTLVL